MIDRYGLSGRGMSLRQLMDRMLEDAFVMPREGGAEGGGGPSMDVYEEGDTLVVEAHLPGMKPDDLEVNVERGVLTISGRTEAEQERKERNYLLREKRVGRFTRSVQLPASYTADPPEASFEHRLLRLVFPKAEEAKPRRIQIGTGGQRAMSSGETQAQPEGARRANHAPKPADPHPQRMSPLRRALFSPSTMALCLGGWKCA